MESWTNGLLCQLLRRRRHMTSVTSRNPAAIQIAAWNARQFIRILLIEA